MRPALPIASIAFLLLTGCSVNVRKGDDGQQKDVSIQVPFGGLQVRNGRPGHIVDTGMPVYSGATPAPSDDHDGDKSVDLHMGFGPYQVRVQVASYVSSDSRDKVETFYRKKLGRYGEVLTCRGDQPVGQPTRTGQGLTCSDQGEGKSVHSSSKADLELKAGSPEKQHIVAFDDKQPGTHFALVALTLPSTPSHSSDDESDSQEQ